MHTNDNPESSSANLAVSTSKNPSFLVTLPLRLPIVEQPRTESRNFVTASLLQTLFVVIKALRAALWVTSSVFGMEFSAVAGFLKGNFVKIGLGNVTITAAFHEFFYAYQTQSASQGGNVI